MKLMRLYLIGVFIMIGILAISTFMQFQQFQQSFGNLNALLPPELSTEIPNANSIINELSEQSQKHSVESNATSTKEYIDPDGQFEFLYDNKWQETNISQFDSKGGEVLFSAQKNNDLLLPIANYLVVEKLYSENIDEVINEYKDEADIQSYNIKINKSEIIKDGITSHIIVIERKPKIITNGNFNLSIKTALTKIENRIYAISVIYESSDEQTSQEAEKIFESINIRNTTANDNYKN